MASLVDAYLRQIFSAGVFHGAPHPGNVFVLADGRLCLHDFGLVGVFDRATRANLASLMQALQHQDGEWLLDACLDLGILQGTLDRQLYRRKLEELVQDYARLPLRDWSFGEAFVRISRMGQGRHLHLPHNLLVLLCAVFLMESAGDLGGQRGRLTSVPDRLLCVELIREAMAAGCRLQPACTELDISQRTFQRWVRDGDDAVSAESRTTVARPEPTNKLSEDEREQILIVANSEEFASLPPSQIVPALADRGLFIASESSFYRVLKAASQQHHRGRAKKPSIALYVSEDHAAACGLLAQYRGRSTDVLPRNWSSNCRVITVQIGSMSWKA